MVCARCEVGFSVCCSCWRQRRYCGKLCRDEGREESKKKARTKYAQSEAGLESGRDRQKRFRIHHEIEKPEKTVTDHPTACIKDSINPHCCLFCGVEIGRLFRCTEKFRRFSRKWAGEKHGRLRSEGTLFQRR